MSYALGLSRRTSAYHTTVWNPRGKMGAVQGTIQRLKRVSVQIPALLPQSFEKGVLGKFAIFWLNSDEQIFRSNPVPSGIIYAVESLAILVSRSWQSSLLAIQEEAVS